MTDPEFADATYIEPITPEVVRQIIDRERPDALLATLGGQTALNTAIALADTGVLEEFGVRAARRRHRGHPRGGGPRSFSRRSSTRCGRSGRRERPLGDRAHASTNALLLLQELGYPVVVRPGFTLGGKGGGIAYDEAELRPHRGRRPRREPDGQQDRRQVLLEESILGWKEFELELMRDRADNVVVVCSIENVDPMGVHTGDSVTVAPAMTLTDREYQRMRDVAIAIMRAVGVDAGGCNIQFAVEPTTGRLVVIEMNPRVSRSSALASKATGFPIAKISAKLAARLHAR